MSDDEIPDEQRSWPYWARHEGWKVLKYEEDTYGDRTPGVWVVVEAGMTVGSEANPYVVVVFSRESAVELAVDLALDYLQTSETESFANQEKRWRDEWADLKGMRRRITRSFPDSHSFSGDDLRGILSSRIIDLANEDGARLSIVFAKFAMGGTAGVEFPPRAPKRTEG